MECVLCKKETDDDYIVMSLLRIKQGIVHSYPEVPVVLCVDCYKN